VHWAARQGLLEAAAAKKLGPRWPPREGDRVEYVPTGEIRIFTGENNMRGGYKIVDEDGKDSGGIGVLAIAPRGDWRLL
jgi:hypothetical protein